MHAHGAVFAEVKVDPELGQIRATRLWRSCSRHDHQSSLGAEPILQRNDLGISFALHEQAVMDQRTGRIMKANLAEYHVPVIADVPSLEAILVEHDPHVNALGVKGVG
jgi:xanthine dehydrogenase YagR molybdenum-binding subunit